MLKNRWSLGTNRVDAADRTRCWTLRWVRSETEHLIARCRTAEATESIRADLNRCAGGRQTTVAVTCRTCLNSTIANGVKQTDEADEQNPRSLHIGKKSANEVDLVLARDSL